MSSKKVFQVIVNRRSVRSFLSKEVSRDILLKIMEACRWAPSAHNAQPWRFIFVADHNIKRRLAEAMAEEWTKDLTRDGVSSEARESLVESSIRRFTQAPALVIASITMEGMDKYPDERRQKIEHLMATQSLAAAIQNMLLAAYSEGLGSCWFCAPLFCQDAVRKVLKIPENIEPQALITLGYPSEQPERPPRKPLKDIVFKNLWGESF